MTRHIERHNKDSSVLKYVCSVCSKAYRYAASLLKHERSVHKQRKPYTCNICGKGKTTIGDNTDVNLLIRTKVLMPISNHILSSGTSAHNMSAWFPLGLENRRASGKSQGILLRLETSRKRQGIVPKIPEKSQKILLEN